jgi:hypothetical protein
MRKKGLVERIIMRAPSEKSFSAEKLPDNRRKLFSYMIKNKFSKIYKNHLLIGLFFLPLVVWGILTMDYSNMIFSLDPREGIVLLPEYWVTVYVTAISLWVIAFVGLSGGLNVLRKLAWSDPVILKHDFIHGIKSSAAQMSLVGFIFGTVFALIKYAMDWLGFYYRVFDSSSTVIFGIFVCIFVLIVAIGMTVYMSCMSSMYRVTLVELLVGSFKLYFADFLNATGVLLLSLLPIVVLFAMDYAISRLIGYFVILLSVGILIIPMFLMCHHSFDRIINKKDYPDYYGKGLSYGTYSAVGEEMIEQTPDQPYKNYEMDDFERVTDE